VKSPRGTAEPGDSQPPVAQVDVVDEDLADCFLPGGVDGGQAEDQAPGRGGRGSDGGVDVGLCQGLDHLVVVASCGEAGNRVAEHRLGLDGEAEQRTQCLDGVIASSSALGAERRRRRRE